VKNAYTVVNLFSEKLVNLMQSDVRFKAKCPKFDFRSSGPHGWILGTGMEGKGRERKGRGEKKGKGSEREKERRRRQWEEEGEIGMGKGKGGIL